MKLTLEDKYHEGDWLRGSGRNAPKLCLQSFGEVWRLRKPPKRVVLEIRKTKPKGRGWKVFDVFYSWIDEIDKDRFGYVIDTHSLAKETGVWIRKHKLIGIVYVRIVEVDYYTKQELKKYGLDWL